MATQKERPDSWKARGLIKRDFQHDHSGPEELPHRKKGKGKKFCIRNKGAHVYEIWGEWRSYASYRYRYKQCKCGKQGWYRDGAYQSQYLREVTYFVNGEPVTEKRWC